MKQSVVITSITLKKLVNGGQCLAETDDGKKIFVWGGLPGELVDIKITKKKRSYLEGIVIEIRQASKDRVEPLEPKSYLSTSPWQIMTFKAENQHKQLILQEIFEREKIKGIEWTEFFSGKDVYGYRNKMEIGFWGDEQGLHLAHYTRGTHGKQIVESNALVADCINQAARDVRDELNSLDIWAGKLKTLVLRSNNASEVVGALFFKEKVASIKDFKLPSSLKGIEIYYSDPKSPASIPTKKLYSLGDIKLTDSISGMNITYDVLSFFQVNLLVFNVALSKIKSLLVKSKSIDLYSGVGTIGIVAGSNKLVEVDENNCNFARLNSKSSGSEVICTSSEKALDIITPDETVIIDPPRAGLHPKMTEKLAEALPPQIVYLSCNPVTQARDVKILEEFYDISFAQGFNFFPRTPHIESLIVLELKK